MGVSVKTLGIDRLNVDEKLAPAYRNRGREYLRAGRIRESIVVFDTYVRLRPQAISSRGNSGAAATMSCVSSVSP